MVQPGLRPQGAHLSAVFPLLAMTESASICSAAFPKFRLPNARPERARPRTMPREVTEGRAKAPGIATFVVDAEREVTGDPRRRDALDQRKQRDHRRCWPIGPRPGDLGHSTRTDIALVSQCKAAGDGTHDIACRRGTSEHTAAESPGRDIRARRRACRLRQERHFDDALQAPVRSVTGCAKALAPKARPSSATPEQIENERLRRRNERLEDELAKHKLALEIQGKASELLERLLAESDPTTRRQP